jgi:peptidyl-dipeptidase Dcp
MNAPNPLLSRWGGPHGGVPPFDQVKVEHFKPALEAAMQEHLAEIERIAADPAPPTFGNVIAALERSGRALDRVERVYSVFSTTMRSPAFQDVEREMEPKMAAMRDRIVQNAVLFERISAVYATRAESGLTAEEQRLVWLTDFARRGARLDPAAKVRLSINQRLAPTPGSPNVLADEGTVDPRTEADLADRPSRAFRRRKRRASAAARASGRFSTRARRWSRSSPTRSAGASARKSGAPTTAAATTATRATTRRSSPRSCACAAIARSFSATRATRTGASR